MTRNGEHTVFTTYHPAVIFAYFVVVIVFSFAVLQPIYVVIALVCACSYYVLLKGVKVFLSSCRLYVPIFLVVSVINPLLSHMGQTTLFVLAGFTFTWEALCYGMCAGAMLVTVLVWFSCYTVVMTNDKFLFLFARIVPSISLVMTMILRFVPSLVSQGRSIADSQAALLGTTTGNSKDRISHGVRMASILASLGMENSIETADSMNARGFGVTKRTHYARYRWATRDTSVCFMLAAFAAANAFLAYVALQQFSFYPAMPLLSVWWGYAVYIVMLSLPLIIELGSMFE